MPPGLPPDIRRRACCFHEAGHALIGIACGYAVARAVVHRPNGFSGETVLSHAEDIDGPLADPAIRETLARKALYLSAGYAAEELFYARLAPGRQPLVSVTNADDLLHLNAITATMRLDPKQAKRFRDEHHREALNQLATPGYWPVLARFAEELFQRWEVSRRVMDGIVAAARVA